MGRKEDHEAALGNTADVVAYLRRHSYLPGPRGNLELLQAAADVGEEADFGAWIVHGSGQDPTDEFLVACAATGLGRLVAEGRRDLLPQLRRLARDPRWRVREGVAMGLQRVGDADLQLLFAVAREWSTDPPYVQRAAVAAVAEPRLLATAAAAPAAQLVPGAVEPSAARAATRHKAGPASRLQ